MPSQGPITVFAQHNTLHAFEGLPFDEAVKKAGSTYGCHPHLTEDCYRGEIARGRILTGGQGLLLPLLLQALECRLAEDCAAVDVEGGKA